MVFPFNWPGQDQEQLGKNVTFAEPFSWLKNIGDAVGTAWRAPGQINFPANQPRGNTDYNPFVDDYGGRDAGELSGGRSSGADIVRPRNSGPSGGVENALKALQGGFNSPSPYGQEGTPPSLMAPPEVDTVAAEYEARAQKIQALMDALEMGTENTGLVDEAFAGSLAAIEKARGSAQNNFNESDAAIQGLTQGHVNEIKTVDRKAVEDNGNQLTSDLTNTYDTSKNTIAADQKAELSARAEMLQRLGIQEAGLGNAGQAQSQAMTRLTEDKGAQLGRASNYKAADLTRNTEMAAAQATEGVERRSDLRRQLDGINADLDRDTASVENSKAQARIAGTNADKEAYLKQLQFYSDELQNLEESKTARDDKAYDRAFAEREFNAKNSPKALGGALDIASQQVASLGEDPSQYADAYAQVSQANEYDSRAGKDKISDTVSRMTKKNPRLTPSVALRYVMSIENFGTDKGNTPIQ